MNIVQKAKQLIYKEDFSRKWENLFENGENLAMKVIDGLYKESQKDEHLKHLIKKNKDYIPVILYKSLFNE